MNLRQVLDHYETFSGYKGKRIAMDSYQIRCVSHEDKTASLTISRGKEDKVLIHCHAGCSFDEIITTIGLKPSDLFEKAKKTDPYKVTKAYPYRDKNGDLLFQMERSNHYPKGLPVRFTDKGEKVWGLSEGEYFKIGDSWRKAKNEKERQGTPLYLKAVPRVLYNLPELIHRPAELVVIVGGEKDAENLTQRGLLATTNSLGEGKWSVEYNAYFKNRPVVIIPDNDDAGEAHAKKVKSYLERIAASVKIVDLGMAEKGADVSDYLETHSFEDLLDLIYETKLPNARVAEEFVLGAIFLNNTLLADILDNDISDKFFVHANKNIIKAMLECFSDSLTIDKITVGEKLGTDALLASGGYGYLEDLIARGEETESIKSHLKVIAEKAEARELVKNGKLIAEQALTTKDPQQLKNQFLSILVPKDSHEDSVHSASELSQIFVETFDDQPIGAPCGLYDFDNMSGGLQEKDLFIVAGRPAMGKTTLALNMAMNMAVDDYVLFFSLEMSKEQLIRKAISRAANVDINSFMTKSVSPAELTRVNAVYKDLPEKLLIDDRGGINVAYVRAKLYNLKIKNQLPRVVFIDYLQKMASQKYSGQRHQEVADIARGLKDVAKELGITVVALAQLSRSVENRVDKRPVMSDLKESGDIEQEADVVTFVYRDEYYNPQTEYPGVAEWIVGKGRNIRTGTIFLAFIGEQCRFENLIY